MFLVSTDTDFFCYKFGGSGFDSCWRSGVGRGEVELVRKGSIYYFFFFRKEKRRSENLEEKAWGEGVVM